MKIGILRESKSPPDKRVVLSPLQCKQLLHKYKHVELVVQPSKWRKFSDHEYSSLGINIQEDLSDCDVLFGIKEVDSKTLIPHKKYFFFSHTVKEQPQNRDLLRRILELEITLIDYELLTDLSGSRVVGFGRYAGIVGCYNAFYTYGKRMGTFDLKRAYLCEDRFELESELKKIKLDNIKIVVTGTGRVGKGVNELLKIIGVKQVSIDDFLHQSFNESVFVQLGSMDYYSRVDANSSSKAEFYSHPNLYQSDFNKFAEVADVLISGHYHTAGAPCLFERDDVRNSTFTIKIVSDISCDVNGSIPSTLRFSSIEDPIYGYDPMTEKEVDDEKQGVLSVVAIDNLPCELPKDASEAFGEEMLHKVLPCLFLSDEDGLLDRGTICEAGKLKRDFNYLKSYIA